MRIPFRQGIIRWQTDITNKPSFLQKSSLAGDYIDLIVSPDPTVFTIAHAGANYLIEETQTIPHAWGPFQAHGQTQYLYWDINQLDGTLTRGYTLFTPVIGAAPPPGPQQDQHWYDTNVPVMKVWNNGKWQTKLRIFAAIYDSSATILMYQPSLMMSQVNNNHECNAGFILLNDQGYPLRDRDSTLLTTESGMIVSRSAYSPIKVEGLVKEGMAIEAIPKFYLVSIVGKRRFALASSNRVDRQVAGMVVEDMHIGDVARLITNGNVANEQWNWPDNTIGKPLFCGPNGQVLLTPPSTGIVQQIGLVVDTDNIELNLMIPIKL